MKDKNLVTLELDKILSAAANYAVLERGAERLRALTPSADVEEVRRRLDVTGECDKLLFYYGVGKVPYFPCTDELLSRAEKGAALTCGELLDCNALLVSARAVYEGLSAAEGAIPNMRVLADKLVFDRNLEDDIAEKIISREAVADGASERLYAIRTRIRALNERIRGKLSEYLSRDAAYLQDGIVTIRNDRYVIPVKSEYKGRVRGFVHDRSASGATYFIEPEQVLELNNELIGLTIDEREEVERILKSLSSRLGKIARNLIADGEILSEIDCDFAIAEYAYSLKCVKPDVNDRGRIDIINGRHPLVDRKSVVPVSIAIGKNYDFLILSGANTGGKTVTLKTCGLFCAMAACGLFLPAAEGTSVGVFGKIFCSVGDSQSIEENLSTFSSHILSIKQICEQAGGDSLVLIDELGGGTNPDEGQALAMAVVKKLVNLKCKGIVTTHFTALKEFAYSLERVENACMEFDSDTLLPLYRVKTGLPGASNALAISKRLGLDGEVLADALNFLSEGARSFENVLSRAEQSRVEAQAALDEAKKSEAEWNRKLAELNESIEKVNLEREKLNRNARAESRKIIAERTERAEEILDRIEEIFKKAELDEADLIEARTLKNKLKDAAFAEESPETAAVSYAAATKESLKEGCEVYVEKLQTKGKVTSYVKGKSEAEVQVGSIKMHCKVEELKLIPPRKQEQKPKFKVVKSIPVAQPALEINVVGLTVTEALAEVENFLDRAVTDNLEEVKIIHGVGTGKLRSAIAERLKRHKNVESFRLGKYGEGETGVTIVRLK